MPFSRAEGSLFGKLHKWVKLIDTNVLKSMLKKIKACLVEDSWQM